MRGADEEQQEEEEELDARLLQTAAAEQPACELCGQRDSLPLQGPLRHLPLIIRDARLTDCVRSVRLQTCASPRTAAAS